MTGTPAGAGFGRFALLAGAVAALLAALGWVPAGRFTGVTGSWAWVAACGVSWVASLVGALPLIIGVKAGEPMVSRALAATGLRLITTVMLGLAVGLTGPFEPRTLLVGLAASYVLLLAVDTWFAVGRAKVV